MSGEQPQGPERAVYVRLKGGLGNQMFQYAAGLAAAARHDCPLKLDLGYFATDPLRDYQLDAFRIDAPVAAAAEIAAFGVDNAVRRRLAKRLRLPALLPDGLVVEPHFHADPALLDRAPPLFLDGYWQSERYFAPVADDLRRQFALKAPLGEAAAEMHARIAAAAVPVSVHVRRGDYVAGKAAAKMAGSCTPDYYRRAVARVCSLVPQATLFVFSDEPDAADEILSFAARREIVRGDPDRPAEDLALMSACAHHIIANSSFSWWGAWLNGTADKLVIAPRLWFARDYLRRHDSFDLYPDDWLTLG